MVASVLGRARWFLCLLAGLAAFTAPAAAGPAYNLGGQTFDEPSVVAYGNNKTGRMVAVFVRGTDGALWWNTGPDSGGFYGWESLGGIIIGAPSCIARENMTISCFGRGTDDALWHLSYDIYLKKWLKWSRIGGTLTAPPAAVLRDDLNGGRSAQVYVRTTGGELSYTYLGGGAWQPWYGLKVNMKYAPGCGNLDTTVSCAFKFPFAKQISVMRAMAASSSQAKSIDGDTNYRAVLISDPFTQATAFVIVTGLDNHVWAKRWRKGLGWDDWKQTPFTTQTAPACTWQPNKGIWCAMVQDDRTTSLVLLQPSVLAP